MSCSSAATPRPTVREGQRQAKSALIAAPPCSDPSLINAWGAAVLRAKAESNGTPFEEFQ
jgi:hypothetical protein